ncbi:hypothetical protein WJX79_008802 [Trebouxia sp. C0005]
MTDRLFERAFNRAAAANVEEPEQPVRPRTQSIKADAGAAVPQPAVTPMQISDAIQRVLLADNNKDYFGLMELPLPEADEIGRPSWNVTSADISKAYRRLSVLVHPDKNPGEDARKAFEALNDTYRKLRDPSQLDEILKGAAVAAVQRREAAEATATPDERIAINHAKAVKANDLRKKETSGFQAEILRQQQQKQEIAKRKRMMASKSRQKKIKEEEEVGQELENSDKDDEDDRPVLKRRSKPKFMF